MGFFSDLKDIFKLMREIKANEDITDEERERILSMSVDEMRGLSDRELFSAVDLRIDSKLVDSENLQEVTSKLNECEKIFFAVQNYDIYTGDSLQCFFKSVDSFFAPDISEYLEKIGAYDHKRLFDIFVRENNINLNDLSEFVVSGERELKKLKKRYPIDRFDEEFHQLKGLDEYLLEFVRQNIKEF